MTRLIAIVFISCVLAFPQRAKADPLQELIMSSAYGVLAGTLVGAATLAFTEKPGDNLKNIARGASLGLYAGILLGLYVIYAVPDDGEEEEEYPEAGVPIVYPVIGDNNSLDGAAVSMKVFTF